MLTCAGVSWYPYLVECTICRSHWRGFGHCVIFTPLTSPTNRKKLFDHAFILLGLAPPGLIYLCGFKPRFCAISDYPMDLCRACVHADLLEGPTRARTSAKNLSPGVLVISAALTLLESRRFVSCSASRVEPAGALWYSIRILDAFI